MNDTKTMTADLGEPFPLNAVKVHPQTKMKYVEGHTYIHRLIGATNNTWDWKIVRQDFHPYGATAKGNARLLITVIGELTIPGLGTRAGMGVQVVTADTGGEDMWKGAMTDAIKAAAKLFGVGLELYGPDYEAGEIPELPNRDRSTSRNTLSEGVGATLTHAKVNETQDVELMSTGQYNVIVKHQKDLGWSIDDMKAIVAAHNKATIKEFTAQQARDLITVMADPAQADPYLAKMRTPSTQAQMIDTSDASARARN